MAAIRWNGDLDKLITHLNNVPEELEQAVTEVTQESVDEGSHIMYEKVGRIDTGVMRESVGSGPVAKSDSTVSGWFGWPDEKVEPYFVYQEQGFNNVWSGEDVPPMHALLESFIVERESWFSRLKALMK